MSMSGGCLCGAVRFEADDVDTEFHICHCSMCRRSCGGPAMGASVGELRFADGAELGRYTSSGWAERGFCRSCGSQLFFRVTESDQYVLWIGAFDDQSAFRLAGEIFVDDKPPGYDFAGDHPRMTGAEFIGSLQEDGG